MRFENSYPHQLSGGMRRRTTIAQTWIGGPGMLLMDEPFAALDAQTRQLMEHELLSLWTGSGKTVLFITHDLDEAISLSDEIVLLSAGPASRIVGRYPVGLPRPRDLLGIRTRPPFTEIYGAIWADLRNEVMKTYERITSVEVSPAAIADASPTAAWGSSSPRAARRRCAVRRSRLVLLAAQVGLALVFVLGWQLGSRSGAIDSFFSAPTDIARRIGAWFGSGTRSRYADSPQPSCWAMNFIDIHSAKEITAKMPAQHLLTRGRLMKG